MPSNTKTRKPKTMDISPAESTGPDIVPIGNLYPEPETKTEDNPQAPAWFIMITEEQATPDPAQSISSLDPEELLRLWNSQGSPGMFNRALSNLMNEHPAFAYNPNTPLTRGIAYRSTSSR